MFFVFFLCLLFFFIFLSQRGLCVCVSTCACDRVYGNECLGVCHTHCMHTYNIFRSAATKQLIILNNLCRKCFPVFVSSEFVNTSTWLASKSDLNLADICRVVTPSSWRLRNWHTSSAVVPRRERCQEQSFANILP